jgi:hypothetical protein
MELIFKRFYSHSTYIDIIIDHDKTLPKTFAQCLVKKQVTRYHGLKGRKQILTF